VGQERQITLDGSRDLRRIYAIDAKEWTVVEEREAPGIPWAAVGTNGTLRFTIGEGPDDDRYIRRFVRNAGFSETDESLARSLPVHTSATTVRISTLASGISIGF